MAGSRRGRRTLASCALAAAVLTACSDEPEPSVAALCRELEVAEGLDESLAVADAEALEGQAAALRRAVSVAPPDIEPAVSTLSLAIDDLTGPLSTATGDRRETLRELLAATEDRAEALTAAGRSLSEWSATNCGLDLDSGTTVPTTPVPTSAAGGATTEGTDEAPAP
ncbi:hypothetical protein [Rhabdothermincola salaria]|uniref:hypothetical protein n=1 Tax=Rhabdothermincola salaria TaxID=2903142 RepID=UPI001E6408A8|nr:hypothetical protein [Rhabdothermincola salaria]MCD9623251.1 hypothetical protein [Rhabdothermincola salaria]